MPTVTSTDGTQIAYEVAGSGPALVLVDGALCWRAAGVTPDLMPVLSKHFTVYAYDRRGRGESGALGEYDIDRELDDLKAVMDAAGGSPYVCGISSGAVLAMYAVAHGANPAKLALFEPPVTAVDESSAPPPADALPHVQQLIAQDRRGDAVRYFLVDVIGMPSVFMLVMKTFWRKGWNTGRQVAHTLPYDFGFMARAGWRPPADAAQAITMPCVVIGGEKSGAKLRKAVEATAAAIPGATVVTVPKQSHMIKPVPMTETLVAVFAD